MKLLCVLSLPRSGTNHFIYNILASNSGVLSLGEIFHNMEKVVQAEFFNSVFPSYESFRRSVQDDPAGTLRRVTGEMKADLAIFKVFPDHISKGSFEKLAKGIDGFVVLTRNPLSVWVSHRIAAETGAWGNKGTDSHSISWSFSDFIDRSIDRLDFLNTRVSFLKANNIPYIELAYSEIRGADTSPQETLQRIASAIPSIRSVGWDKRLPENDPIAKEPEARVKSAFLKQDTRAPLMRIENWQEAGADLERWGLQWLVEEDAAVDRIALLNLLKEIRKVRAAELRVGERERAASGLTAGGIGKEDNVRRTYARRWQSVKRWVQRVLPRQ
jgi:hypothetical protein